MKTIYKYEIGLDGVISDIHPPRVVRPLHAGLDPATGMLSVWLLVETDSDPRPFRVRVAGTGWPLELEDDQYLGTVHDGGFVWHVFTEPVE